MILGFPKETNMKEYPKEFKLESVRLYLEKGKNIRKTMKELGIPYSTLKGWIKKYMKEVIGESKVKPLKRNYEKELLEKDKQIDRLEEEIIILKKSIGIFTRDPQRK